MIMATIMATMITAIQAGIMVGITATAGIMAATKCIGAVGAGAGAGVVVLALTTTVQVTQATMAGLIETDQLAV